MKQAAPEPVAQPRDHSRAILWAVIALYAFILPDFYTIYKAIVDSFGKEAAGRVPVIMVVLAGIGYAAAILLLRRRVENAAFLLPAAMIAVMIMGLEPNPNKHIHIPEYVLLTWLLYAVLSKDYMGSGLFILIFVCASLIGVVDELEQGIHPKRFYGWSDMLVNSASALIGILTIMGLKGSPIRDWSWRAKLGRFKPLIGLAIFGFVGIVITCVYLFQVQALEMTRGVYPVWLVIWNVLFLLSAPVIAHLASAPLADPSTPRRRGSEAQIAEAATARLWVVPPLVILLYMHALAAYTYATGLYFR